MKKRLAALLLSITLLCTGCTAELTATFEQVLDAFFGFKLVEQAEAIPRIGFASGELFEEGNDEIILPASDFSNPELSSSAYRSSFHYDTLSEEHRLIYHALEYAMENAYSYILVDDKLVEDTETLLVILDYLSLDSPLLEQNLWYETGVFNTYEELEAESGFPCYADFTGYYLCVGNFSAELWKYKQKALTKAQEIVADLPEDASDVRKAEILYRYLGDAVAYEDSGDTLQPYLFNALVVGESNCDGFANAFSLLTRLAGLECFEKIDPPDTKSGHTWNCIRLDGSWYNMDATGAQWSLRSGCSAGPGLSFAYSDQLQEELPLYNDLYPACAESLYLIIDGTLSEIHNDRVYLAVHKVFKEKKEDWCVLLVDTFNEAVLEPQMQKLANESEVGISWSWQNTHDGRVALFVYDSALE